MADHLVVIGQHRLDGWPHSLLPHFLHLCRHTWQGNNPAVVVVVSLHSQVDTGRRAMRIWHDLTTCRKHRLDIIALWHGATPPAEELFDMLHGGGILDKLQLHRVSERLPSQVIRGRSQAAGTDHQVSSLAGQSKNLHVGFQAIGHGGVIEYSNTQLAQLLTEPLAVGVESLATSEFVTNGDDLRVHEILVVPSECNRVPLA